MSDSWGLTMGIAAAGLLALAGTGSAVAQRDTVPRLEIDSVARELDLSDATRSALTPLLERLNAAWERREAHVRQGEEIRDELAATYDRIAETLTAAELREFHLLVREAAHGAWAGRSQRGYFRGDAIGGRVGRGGAIRGGRGYGSRGTPMRRMRDYPGARRPARGIGGLPGWGIRPGGGPASPEPNG
jgi:hypothetical protein